MFSNKGGIFLTISIDVGWLSVNKPHKIQQRHYLEALEHQRGSQEAGGELEHDCFMVRGRLTDSPMLNGLLQFATPQEYTMLSQFRSPVIRYLMGCGSNPGRDTKTKIAPEPRCVWLPCWTCVRWGFTSAQCLFFHPCRYLRIEFPQILWNIDIKYNILMLMKSSKNMQ